MTIGWLVLALAYLTVLFWIAKWGDSNSPTSLKLTSHPLVYSLALGIYCTAWTFFGAVGQSSTSHWMYLPILLGPIIVYVGFYKFIHKLVYVSKKQHISTIADFISSRYGKRQVVALLVTVIALMATIPYIALQLKAIGSTFQLVTNQENSQLIVIIAASFIALFAMYFGTRNTDVTQNRRGLMLAISFESCIKLAALVLIAIVGYSFWSKNETQPILATYFESSAIADLISFDFWAQTLMAAAAIICLPRQFHIAVIDNLHIDHLKTARWFFPLYLTLIAITIPIIAVAGKAIFAGQSMEADNYVMGIALFSDSLILEIIVFLGGLSAATAMIIVATLTLSTMITNDVVLPKLMDADTYEGVNRVKRIKHIRRAVIFIILLLSFAYQQQMASQASLAAIGLLAFSLVVQLLPSIVGGLYWERGHAHGVYAGLLVGFSVWFMLIFLSLIETGAGILQPNLLSKAAIYSLLINTLFYIGFSLLSKPKLIDRIQAKVFVNPISLGSVYHENKSVAASVGDLKTLLSRFAGELRADQLFELYSSHHNNKVLHLASAADEPLLNYCERALGGAIGSSSAKALIESLVGGEKLDITDVVNIFDDTNKAAQFNMSALLISLENIEQGISVIDKDLNLVAWNKRYIKIFSFPDEMVYVGAPIETLIKHNIMQTTCDPSDVIGEVNKRIEHLKNRAPHRVTSVRDDGHVIEIIGNPLPNGGFVTSFNDITEHIRLQAALKESNLDLSARVEKRTQEVHSINAELRLEIERRTKLEKSLIRARQEAELANQSKTRFLSLASHDVLQPLNAAKLYLTALEESDLDTETRNIIKKLNDSVVSSEALIGTILDISRLDQGELKPFIENVYIRDVITPIINEITMGAKEKGLEFSYRIVDCWIKTDSTYLYRIIQNFATNALKYTKSGKILITVRRRLGKVIIEVRDTGIGIPKLQQAAIFSDFYRVENTREQGAGLGLGIVKRFSQQLECQIKVDSMENKGSCFSIEFVEIPAPAVTKAVKQLQKSVFNELKILCIDDQQENLDAMQTLLHKWGVEVSLANNAKSALEIAESVKPHILLVDYQLGKGPDGLEIINNIRSKLAQVLPACLITAKRGDDLLALCKEQNVSYLSKPIKPAKLRALIQSMSKPNRNDED